MIPVTTFKGKSVTLFGLGGSGLATALALAAGGADVIAWDDSSASVENASAAGIRTGDLRNLAGARETADDLLKGVRGVAPPSEPHP